jgi:hypothetical protein
MGIPEPELPVESGEIPFRSAEMPQTAIEPELKPYRISFERYNEKECEVEQLDNKLARKTLEAVRNIGINVKEDSDFGAKLPKLEIKSIRDDGDYRVLFRGIRDELPDIEMREVKIEKDSGRLFFYVIDRIFHIIAIRKNHYDTSKTR